MKTIISCIPAKFTKLDYLFFLVYLVGIIGLTSPLDHLFAPLTPLTILISLIALLATHDRITKKMIYFIIFTFLFGFLSEFLGVKYGLLFGEYTYGNNLGVKWLGVPLIIGVNWLLVMYCTLTIAQKWTQKKWLQIIVTSFFAVFLDFLIEPVAIRFDFWHWEGGFVPVQNYIGWFILSLVISTVATVLNIQFSNKLGTTLYIVQWLFFGLLNVLLLL